MRTEILGDERLDNAGDNKVDDELFRIRHSSAHVMAQAVYDVFGEGVVKLGVGPAITDGFYYDFELPRTVSDDDLPLVEERMREIISRDEVFIEEEHTSVHMRKIFADQPYKLELIDGIVSAGLDDNGEPLPEGESPRLTIYRNGTFTDLCRGPHVESTGRINPDAVKLLSVAGAYWKGDEKRPMLQRLYGTAWKTREELERFLWLRAEAERRDHRRLGKELELFHLEPTAPGMPYWLPNGLKLVNVLLEFWREEHERQGYEEISAPLVNEKSLWATSGHWDHYRDDMFVIPVSEHQTYGLKPMNCPNAMVVYNLKTRSYRSLPYKLSDCDVLHRNERSGTLHGLFRVQRFMQDDAHIFCEEDQIEEVYQDIFDLCDRFYHVFGLTYRFRLGTRPEAYMGDNHSWERAEATLVSILEDRVGKGQYRIEEGGGAFYGPKIDIMMEDSLGRSWQTGTIQLDFQLPKRFNCTYIDRDGKKQYPVVVHRVIYGSFERFIGILIEHTAGSFPLWLSPVQVMIVPVRSDFLGYAKELQECLRSSRIRVSVLDEQGSLRAKVRKAQTGHTPVVLIVGGREEAERTANVRLRGIGEIGVVDVDQLAGILAQEISARSLKLDTLHTSLLNLL